MSKQDLCEVLAENVVRNMTKEELRDLWSDYLYNEFICYSRDTLQGMAEKYGIESENFWEEEDE